MSTLAIPAPDGPRPSRSLYSPPIDFLLLGGGSLLALLAVRAAWPQQQGYAVSLATVAFLANWFNHPHFAHSYQLFYRRYTEKLTSPRYARPLRLGYLVSGLLVPVALAGFFAWTIASANARVLGYAVNGMFFLVGWHYAKQGYGMAMVDAALKRAFYSGLEKKLLLANAFAVWIASWLLGNQWLGQRAQFWGIVYTAVPVGPGWGIVAQAVMWASSVLAVAVLAVRYASRKPVAWNGLVAYAASLYPWLLLRDPVMLLWIPLFHSLQYQAVVWRYQANLVRGHTASRLGRALRLGLFVGLGLGLGYLGFWAAPAWLGTHVPYDRAVFGDSLFFFIFWIFINVHHYFLDTVMWRKGNPDVAEHLFGAPPAATQPA